MNNVGELFSRAKGKMPITHMSNVVYKIKCMNCTDRYFLGGFIL